MFVANHLPLCALRRKVVRSKAAPLASFCSTRRAPPPPRQSATKCSLVSAPPVACARPPRGSAPQMRSLERARSCCFATIAPNNRNSRPPLRRLRLPRLRSALTVALVTRPLSSPRLPLASAFRSARCACLRSRKRCRRRRCSATPRAARPCTCLRRPRAHRRATSAARRPLAPRSRKRTCRRRRSRAPWRRRRTRRRRRRRLDRLSRRLASRRNSATLADKR